MLRRFFYFPTSTCEGPLPEVQFDDCSPELNLSQINKVFLAKRIAAPFSDWTTDTEWLARLSDSTTSGNDYIRTLVVVGDKPAPASVTKAISNNRTAVINKAHTLNWTIDESNQINHEMLQDIEAGVGQYKMWYQTTGGQLLGGNDGIDCYVSCNMVLGAAIDDITTYVGLSTWNNKVTEDRCVSPIFDLVSSGDSEVYDTTLEFSTDATDTAYGITATIAADNAVVMFEFDKITPQVGTPASMTITLNAVNVMTVNFPTDYSGHSFRFIDDAGTHHNGVFVNGTAAF